ncbi:MAG: hypothetical protein JXR97_16160 [Planctomycetes bacterium]|nr:hypothetical protein [Planctomycetota bacterium]
MTVFVQLHIKPGANGTRKTAGWFIPGASAEDWLDEISKWRVALSEITIYPVPTSSTDSTAIGAFIPSCTDIHPFRAVAYSLEQNRIYIPRYCNLLPAPSDAVLGQLQEGITYLFHPEAGLVGFGNTDGQPGYSLLKLPRRLEDDWHSARPGLFYNNEIRSIRAPAILSATEIINDMRDDIGSSPLDSAPKADGAKEDGIIGKALNGMQYYALGGLGAVVGGIAAIGNGLGSLLGSAGGIGAGSKGISSGGSAAGGSGMFDSMSQWFNDRMQKISRRIFESREREITRLSNLLEKNPDLALQYAIPLASLYAHRGRGAPSGNLTRRNVEFSISGSGGARAVDEWNISQEYQAKLRRQYHDTAKREIALGRWKRAAYIYANLLGDAHSAANVLKQGKHWREAAALYKDHLSNKREAARCLEEGGLYTEAIDLCIELKMHEKAGELWDKLENKEKAREMYELALADARAANDVMNESRILCTLLDRSREGIECLDNAWPLHNKSLPALKQSFKLRGEYGLHKESLAIIPALIKSARATDADSLAKAFAEVCEAYPDVAVRKVATDSVLVVSSLALGGVLPARLRELNSAIRQAIPTDPLLHRDATAYRMNIEKQLAARPRQVNLPSFEISPPNVNANISFVKRISYPQNFKAVKALSCKAFLFIFGRFAASPKRLSILCYDLEGDILAHHAEEFNHPEIHTTYSCCETGEHSADLLISAPGKCLRYSVQRTSTHKATFTPSPCPFHDKDMYLAFLSENTIHTLTASAAAISLLSYGETGNIKSTVYLPDEVAMRFEGMKIFELDGSMYAVGLDDIFIAINEPDAWKRMEINQTITGYTKTAMKHVLPRIALQLSKGGIVIWPKSKQRVQFGGEAEFTDMAFIENGNLVAATTAGDIHIYHTSGESIKLYSKRNAFCKSPVSIASLKDSKRFVVACHTDGADILSR